MIGKNCKCFCREDLCLIENYDKAIDDTTQIWDCHHRLEIDLNLSREQMKERGLYYDRPASELIFLTHEDHASLHKIGKGNPMYGRCGELSPIYGKRKTDETKELLRFKAIEQWSDPKFVDRISLERRNRHFKHKEESKQLISKSSVDRSWMNNGTNRVFIKPDKIEYYSKMGYVFGFKLKDL